MQKHFTVNLQRSLEDANPGLAKEWHPSRNGDLKPTDVTGGSGKKVWWKCSKGHEWQASIRHRHARGQNCPYCAGRMVCTNNCLATVNPILTREWHTSKNERLTPKDVTAGCNKKVWWKCSKGHEWKATVNGRNAGLGCPYCSGKAVCDDNCLQTINPTLAKQWNLNRNGSLTPKDFGSNSNKKVWWQCSRGHEWQAKIADRNRGNGCPYCSGRTACEDNCLNINNPELSKEWHSEKNGKLTPKSFTANSNKKVWWKCRKGHEWKAKIADRNRGSGCPYCSGRAVCEDNCLHFMKFVLVKEWHPNKNGELTPKDVTAGSDRIVWWKCKRGHEWQAPISRRNNGARCPFCQSQTSELELRVLCELKHIFCDIEHRKKYFGKECDLYIPGLNLAIEIDGVFWHKNKLEKDKCKDQFLRQKGISVLRVREAGLEMLSASDILVSKNETDLTTIKQIAQAILKLCKISAPIRQALNKYLARDSFVNDRDYRQLWHMLPSPLPGKSLYDKRADIAKEWHLERNGTLTSYDVTTNSNRKVWWQCSQGHEWQATVNSRTGGNGCPYCSGKAVCKDNCLQTVNPALANEWHPYKNKAITPEDVMIGSHKRIWWICQQGHEWQAAVYTRKKGIGCPYCSGRLISQNNSLAFLNPALAQQWHPVKNGDLTPKDLALGSGKKVWWQCEKEHEWQATVNHRKAGTGCPFCARKKTTANLAK